MRLLARLRGWTLAEATFGGSHDQEIAVRKLLRVWAEWVAAFAEDSKHQTEEIQRIEIPVVSGTDNFVKLLTTTCGLSDRVDRAEWCRPGNEDE